MGASQLHPEGLLWVAFVIPQRKLFKMGDLHLSFEGKAQKKHIREWGQYFF